MGVHSSYTRMLNRLPCLVPDEFLRSGKVAIWKEKVVHHRTPRTCTSMIQQQNEKARKEKQDWKYSEINWGVI